MLKKQVIFYSLLLLGASSFLLKSGSDSLRAPSSNTRGLSNYNYSRSYLSLNDTVSYSGITSRLGEDDKYVRRIFGKLIQKADSLAREDLYKSEKNIFRNYYAFLMAGIQIPFHESGLMHFRESTTSVCSDYSNNILDPLHKSDYAIKYYDKKVKAAKRKLEGKLLSKEKNKTKKELKTFEIRLSNANFLVRNTKAFFRNSPYQLPFPHCSKLNKKDKVQQILFSNDYADIGLMMINANAHSKVIKSGDIFHVDRVIDYGMKHLYKGGFLRISRDSHKYSCLKGVERSNPVEYAKRLIRGAWAGRYNSGNVRKTCRFLNRKDIFYKNDVGFLNNLNKTFEEGKLRSYYHKFLPENSLERDAFFELLNNVKNQTNNRTYLNAVLNTDYSTEDYLHKGENSVVTNKLKVDSDDAQMQRKISGSESDKNRIIDDDIVVNDSEGDIVQYDESDLTHIIKGLNYNIRKSPINGNNICGNTRLKKVSPVKIAYIGKSKNGFSQISSYNLEDILFLQECRDLDFLYVSNDAIEKIKNFEVDRTIEVKNWSFAKSRPSSILSKNLKVLSPFSQYVVIAIEEEESGDTWYKILLEDGVQAWVILNSNIEVL